MIQNRVKYGTANETERTNSMYGRRAKSSFLSPSEMKVKYSGVNQFSTEREDVDYCALGKPKKINS